MSKYGLKFNNKNSQDFGLVMKSDNRQLLPASKDVYVDIPFIDGTYLFSDKLEDRFIDVEFKVIVNGLSELRWKAREIARWLYTKKRVPLIFDDEKDKVYLAKVANQLDLEQIISLGRFTVTFRCLPLAQLIENVNEITLDSEIILHNDIRLDDEYEFNVTEPTTIQVNNFGTYEVKPTLIINGSFDNLSITVGEKTFEYNQPFSGELEINNEKYIVKSGLINKLSATNGEFLELDEGINDVQISGSNLNFEVVFVFKPLYL